MPLARYQGRTRGAPGAFCPQGLRAWQDVRAQMAHEVNATICRACQGSVACRRNALYPLAEPFCSGAAALQRVWQGLGYRAAGRARGSVSERFGNIERGPVLSAFLSSRAVRHDEDLREDWNQGREQGRWDHGRLRTGCGMCAVQQKTHRKDRRAESGEIQKLHVQREQRMCESGLWAA